MDASRFKEFRADGWPLCPRCGEDELYSDLCLHWMDPNTWPPSLADCLAGEFGCYYCQWRSDRCAPAEALR